MDRSPEIAAFLDASAAALRAACDGAALAATRRVIDRFATTGTPGPKASRLPVCDWIAPALAAVAPERAALAQAFAALEGQLPWARRLQCSPADGAFRDGHANAVILGPGGLEDHPTLWVGATVMAPGILYPRHHHRPEEVYLSLTPGAWWNAGMDWTDPGPAGAIHNPPGILHAMRAGAGPFLALWYLPL